MNSNKEASRVQSRLLRSDHVYGALGHHYKQLVFSKDFFDRDTTVAPVVELPWPFHYPLTSENLKKRDKIAKMNRSNRMFRLQMKKSHADLIKSKIKADHPQLHDHGIMRLTNNVIKTCNDWHLEFPFESKWNPYLTGSLDVLDIDGTPYLIRPNHKFRLVLTPLKKHAATYTLTNPESVERSPIFGLQTLPMDNNILLKHWNSLSIAQVTTLDNQWDLIDRQSFDDPIVHVSHNNANGSDLLVSAVDRNAKCKLWQVNSGSFDDFSGIENASATQFVNAHSIGSVWKHTWQYFDLRESNTAATHTLTTDSIKAPSCDRLLDFHVVDDNLLYLMSTHYLYKFDARTRKPLKYCSHLVRFPSLLSVQDSHVVVSDQRMSHQSTLFYGNGSEVSSLPLALPTLLQSLRTCQMKGSTRSALWGRCFSLDERLTPSLCGVKLLKTNEESLVLYMSNVAGEVFVQNIGVQTTSDKRVTKYLYEWVVNLPKAEVPMHATAVVNMRKLGKKWATTLQRSSESVREERTNFNVSSDLNFPEQIFNSKDENMSPIWRNILAVWDEPTSGPSFAQQIPTNSTSSTPYISITDWVVENEGDDEIEPLPDIDSMFI